MGTRAVGLDFGTTNSAIAIADASGPARLASYPLGDGGERTTAFRSILHFEPNEEREDGPPAVRAGPAAIERYLATSGDGRLIQSLKSFLASALFEKTDIFGTTFRLEELAAAILNELRRGAEHELGDLGERVVVGRPVHFAGEEGSVDELLAMERLRSALAQSGFHEVEFEYEPVAAAYHYGQRLTEAEVVLIGDFGGGTSDFSLLRITPRPGGRPDHEILATAGVGIAGDAFDGKLVRNLVAPLLGRGASYRNPFGDVLPVPSWLYAHLERWHHLSFLKSPRTMQVLADLEREALEPDKIRAFVHLVREDRGFYVYRAVEGAKRELSEEERSRVAYRDAGVGFAVGVERPDFEAWIEPETTRIAGCVDEVLARAGIAARGVDRVFLTGGSSFVPAVRALFERRFGADRIRSGAELTSVASGLALRALDRA